MCRLIPAGTSNRDRWAALILGLVTTMLYTPAFGRGFVSEDFVILRLFHQAQEDGRFLSFAWDHFTGPWLGISLVSFYRPISSLFLQLEAAVFDTFSSGYLGIHLALHLWNMLQVRDLLVRGLGGPGSSDGKSIYPWIGAALFVLYPLHPNTVVFLASFATLTATCFMLFSLRAFLAGRDRTALAAFAVSLGCYEQAIVVPAFILSWAVLVPDRPETPETRTPGRHVPFWILAGSYLILRRLLLGHTVGGYESFRARLLDPLDLLESAATGLGRLVLPSYPAGSGVWMITAAMGVVVVAAIAVRIRKTSRIAGLTVIGLFWALVSLAPFSFEGIVPGNGRYAYVASVGLAVTVTALLAGAESRIPAKGRWIPGFAGLLLCSTYGVRLAEMNRLHREAGLLAEEVRQQIIDLPGHRTEPLFIAESPRFIYLGGVPAAQVFHWGLADAAMPPFTRLEKLREVYPVPPMGDEGLSPLVSSGHGHVYRIEGQHLKAVEPESPPAELALSTLPLSPGESVRMPASPGSVYRLVVSTRGSYHVENLPRITPDSVDIKLPQSLLDSMAVLYRGRDGIPSPAYWWVEQRQAVDGVLQAAGPVHVLSLSAP